MFNTYTEFVNENTEFRSVEQINEAADAVKEIIAKNFVVVPRLTGKVINDAIRASHDKKVVTSDGKWTVTTSKFSGYTQVVISDSSDFFKSGTSLEYTFRQNNAMGFLNVLVNAFSSTNDIDEIYELMKADITISASKTDEKNKSKFKINPFSFKHIKPYAGKIEVSKPLRAGDLIKMIVNNQISSITTAFSYTDDYAADNAQNFKKGWEIDPIKFIEDELQFGKSAAWFDSPNTIAASPHSNKSYTLVLNKATFK